MDNYDRENLFFLLTASQAVLKIWYDESDVEDHEYASELLNQYREELTLKKRFYDSEEVDKVNEAATYLKKFSIGKE